jgi:hypothetical protein
MAILISCSRCRRQLQVTRSQIGHTVRCPSCGLRWKAEMPPKDSLTPKVKKCLRCGQPLEKDTGTCHHCNPPQPAGVTHDPAVTAGPSQPPDNGADKEDASDATPAPPFWRRPLFAIGGGTGPELLLLLLGWTCTVIELWLQWHGPAAVTWSEPWVTVIGVLVVLMLVIWAGNTVRKFVFEGELSSADLGSLFLVVASTSALFWAHHMVYSAQAGNRGDFLPPSAILTGSLLLQVIATWILLRPALHAK